MVMVVDHMHGGLLKHTGKSAKKNILESKNDLHCNCIQRQHRFVSDVPVGFSLQVRS